jgi:RimJ/RimL family protein N-acetyltransferase
MIASDLNPLLEIFGDPIVMASFDSAPFETEQMEAWLQRNLAHQEKYGYGLFSVIVKSTNRLIGDCGLEHMKVEGKLVTELGYDFRSDHWNQGYATEAARAVLDFAFHELGLPDLISLIRVGNQASRRVAEKIGMQLIDKMVLNGINYWKFAIDNK